MDFLDLAGARPSRDVSDFPPMSFAVADEQAGLPGPAATASRRLLTLSTPPADQGDVPCCVAIALTTAMQFVAPTPALAPLFNYFLSRTDPAVIDDVEIVQAFRSAMNQGICLETLHQFPFDSVSALAPPSPAALAEASGRRLVPTAAGQGTFGPLEVDESQWKGAIDQSFPILMGFFMSPEYDFIRQGATLVHASATALGNGHACLVVGYDDARREFTVRDARGPGVGVAGTWQLPYDRLVESLIFESWVVTAVP